MKLRYGRQLVEEDDIRAVVEVLRSDFLTQGPVVERFEAELAKSAGARYAVAVANGTIALQLACSAAGLGPGDEGVTTPITFAASANCIVSCGALPRFADIRLDTWNLDPALLERAMSSKTKVVIPVHFAGLPCDLREIRAIADRNHALVIADACHALGATYEGQAIGGTELADMIVLSFHPVKAITTGEGGAVLTDDETLASRLRRLCHHGIVAGPEMAAAEGGWYHEMQLLGTNARLTDIQCALGVSQLAKLRRFVERRQAIAWRYRQALSGLRGLSVQVVPPDRTHAYHLFVVWLDPEVHDRRRVYDELERRQIHAQVHYIPVHLHPYYQKTFGTRRGQYPVAEQYYAGALSIPIYPAMRDQDVERVVDELSTTLDAS